MRKSLLAGAAVVGMSLGALGSAAYAQTPQPAPTQGKLVTQLNGGTTSAFDNNSSGPEMTRGPIANPTPGTMVIRLNARINTEFTAAWTNLDSVPAGYPNAGNKLSSYTFRQYMRLYPAMDAMAANGLRYGGAIELRENFGNPTNTTASSGGSSYLETQTVYVRRTFMYMAGQNWGYIRIGEADGLIGVYDGGGKTTGVFLSPSGTIVGGDLESAFPSNSWMAPWFAAQSGNEYGNLKAVYLSPQFAGFDFGFQYAPNGFNGFGGSCSSANSGQTCVELSSTGQYAQPPLSAPGSRQRDQYAVGVRYTGNFAGASMFAYAVYMGSGHVNYTGGVPAGGVAGSTYTGQFEGLSLGSIGVNVEYAGLSVFGNTLFGSVNGTLGLKPSGGSDAWGWVAGVRYANGPYTIGALYSQYDSQGDIRLTGISQRHSNVIYAAATYSVAPGLTAFADYAYGTRHQGGYNFLTGQAANFNNGYNDVRSQGFLLGANLAW